MSNCYSLFKKSILLALFFLFGTSLFAVTDNKLSSCYSGGRVQFDHVFWMGDKNDDLLSGIALKNTDLFIKGYLGNDVLSYFIHFSFLNTSVKSNLSQAYIRYKSDKLSLQLGQVFNSFNLERATNFNDKMFMEGALLGELNEVKCFGFNIEYYHNHFSLFASIVVPDLVNSFDRTQNNKYSFLFRSVISPIKMIDTVLHFGFNYKLITKHPEESSPSSVMAFKDVSSFSVINSLLSSHSSVLFKYHIIGFEFASLFDSLLLQCEYTSICASWLDYEREYYKGFYVQVAYMLTGESHIYDLFTGSFAYPHPYNIMGAIELAMRFSYVNLINKGALLRGVSTCDGIKYSYTVGINWIVNKNLKVQFNYANEVFKYRVADMRNVSAIGTRIQFLF